MKHFLFFIIFLCIFSCNENHQVKPIAYSPEVLSKQHTIRPIIYVALLLDTSNSMDGLIDQAKAQLWSIVNELSRAKYKDVKPVLQIALYEYGNDHLNIDQGFIRQVLPFNSDLDDISKSLFSLTTNGGSEFCGHVISTSTKELEWGKNDSDLKLIFIAGNEPFTQGPLPFQQACLKAKEEHITVNTIFCGSYQEGIDSHWKEGAHLTQGHYMALEQNHKTHFVATPFDDDILKLNEKLNDTYIYYGQNGKSKKQTQKEQDVNAVSLGASNAVTRSISKSSYLYNNASWDLVDAIESGKLTPQKLKKEDLPEELKNMSKNDIIDFLSQKRTERDQITKEIQSLNIKRIEFLKSQPQENQTDLQSAMIKAIKKQALLKSYQWESY